MSYMRSLGGGGPNPMTGVLMRREETQRHRQSGKMPYDHRGRDQGDAPLSQEHQGLPQTPEAGGRPETEVPAQPQEEPALRTPRSQVLASRTVRLYGIFLLFKPQGRWYFVLVTPGNY